MSFDEQDYQRRRNNALGAFGAELYYIQDRVKSQGQHGLGWLPEQARRYYRKAYDHTAGAVGEERERWYRAVQRVRDHVPLLYPRILEERPAVFDENKNFTAQDVNARLKAQREYEAIRSEMRTTCKKMRRLWLVDSALADALAQRFYDYENGMRGILEPARKAVPLAAQEKPWTEYDPAFEPKEPEQTHEKRRVRLMGIYHNKFNTLLGDIIFTLREESDMLFDFQKQEAELLSKALRQIQKEVENEYASALTSAQSSLPRMQEETLPRMARDDEREFHVSRKVVPLMVEKMEEATRLVAGCDLPDSVLGREDREEMQLQLGRFKKEAMRLTGMDFGMGR